MEKKSFLKSFRHSIGYLLFKRIFFGYLIFVVSLIGYQVYKEYTFAKNLVMNDMNNAQSSFYNALTTSVWNFSQVDLDNTVQAIINSKTISGVKVLTPRNEIMALSGTVLKTNQANQEILFPSTLEPIYTQNLIEHTFSLVDFENSPDEKLGMVYFYTKESKPLELVKENLFLILLNGISSIIVLWLLFIYFANRMLSTPLEKMIAAAQDFEKEDDVRMDIKLKVKEKTELHILAQAFNKMSATIAEDIINLKQLNMIQEKQKKDLIDANKFKDDFLANMSHELKTPLNSINVISSVMMKNKKGDLTDMQVKNLGIINSCGNDLLYLINDVLDISKLEAGEIIVNNETIDICKVMEGMKDMIMPQVKEKKLNFEYRCDNESLYIYSDEQRIKQIVKNLLSNALKFVHDGGIYLHVKDEGDKIKIIVKDDGIGIPQDKLEHIFDRFKQVDGSTTRKYGGTGLGLAICKELSMLLGGDIEASSQENVGTTFEVSLAKNSEQIEVETAPLPQVEEISSLRVIMLHNDPIGLMSFIVEIQRNFALTQSSDLLEMLREIKTSKFDMVILDATMLLDSELQKVLRNFPLPIILLFSSENEIDDDLLQKVHLSFQKPLNAQEDALAIQQALK